MTGSSLLFALPLLAFFLLVVFLFGRDHDWARAFVLSTIAWAAYLALTSELLSLFQALSAVWVAVVWFLPVAVLTMLVRRSGALPYAWADCRDGLARLSRMDKAIVAGIAVICSVLLGIALISPPNNVDSALYHMARVVHWAQNASLRPYPAILEHQLFKPIWAETAILHLRLLWGNDRPADLVQWFSMVGSLIVVCGIASLLGGRRGAKVLAVAYAVSIPMGILQSTSTQNDYVAAFWAACLAYLVVLSLRRSLTAWELAALAASVGLGTLTKGTAFVYAPPFVAWFLLHELTARGVRRAFVAGLSIAAIAVGNRAPLSPCTCTSQPSFTFSQFWSRSIVITSRPPPLAMA